MKKMNPLIFLMCLFLVSSVYSEETVSTETSMTADSSADSKAEDAKISKPESAPEEGVKPGTAPGTAQKPSQGEGEKAPTSNRSTALPEFSLPEVVITGENELTIGAKRLDRKENDVTLGSHDLTGVERALNDLPGLSKSFTALSTEEAGPGKNTALVLHLGGGVPGTYGGWGLFGQEFKEFEYLLKGHYSTWGGQAIAAGYDGDTTYGYGIETKLFPSAPFSLRFAASTTKTEAQLPFYAKEHHLGIDLSGTADWKISKLVQAQANVTHKMTDGYWNGAATSRKAEELEGLFKITAEDVDPLFNRFSVEVGGRHATSNFMTPAVTAYEWGWVGLQGYLKKDENLGLTVKLQAQSGNGLNLPLQVYPVVDLMWRAFGNSQLNLYWKTDRFVDSFNGIFMNTEHVVPLQGFSVPTELTSEFGGRFTQKLLEKITFSLSASTAQIKNYHQWSDITPGTPAYIQDYTTLSQVQLTKAGANVQWSFMKDWQVAATYQWTQGQNQSGDGKNLTALPTHRGVLSLYRGDEKLETRLELMGASERQAFDTVTGTLPAFVTLGLDATYHFDKMLSLWLNGDNLLGQAYQIQPGYLEPQFHIRAGVEVIF